MAIYTYKEWLVRCEPCEQNLKLWEWSHQLPPKCPMCDQPTLLWTEQTGQAPGVIPDDIPGGVEIRHLSATPERFYSKTEIKRACNERGWTWNGDTPKKYNVAWSGKEKS